MKKENESKLVILSEVLFVLLPITVFSLVHFYTDSNKNLFTSYEWSFATIILFGQSIVKFSSGVSNYKMVKRWQLVSIILSSIIVVGLIPSVLVLVLLLVNKDQNNWIYISQILLFMLSIVSYFVFGTTGQIYLDNKVSENAS